MGFTTGFTGGVTLTLSIAYLTVLAHQKNREHQSAILRQQTRLISGIIDPLPPTLPPTRAELAAAERANLIERAKDRWNAEIEGAVKWAQNKDWEEVREDAEFALARLWAKASGGEVPEKVERDTKDIVARTKSDVGSVAAAAKGAYADAKAKGSEVAAKTEEKAEQTRGSILGSIASVFRWGKEAEQKVEEKALNQR
ncbi:uncharacterized protein F4822DRAFT_427824 [Hypoxylon trugodes]|uniref:uncharacterized protein n=1 Tax=Hypoxylon trugodes TaxID=326681 RepID=UPI0021A0CC13|nr:uncharacterized protein F4822DRAFT_427824 [Hypoxylon trugodes]KAI1389476.1 hypothetical protein F4822DRAFT_427824 [Hypoxylon trugodes]